MSDRKRVILQNIIDTISMKNVIPNGPKYFERIERFGSDRETLGQNKTNFYVNSVASCSDESLNKYISLLKELEFEENASEIEKLWRMK